MLSVLAALQFPQLMLYNGDCWMNGNRTQPPVNKFMRYESLGERFLVRTTSLFDKRDNQQLFMLFSYSDAKA